MQLQAIVFRRCGLTDASGKTELDTAQLATTASAVKPSEEEILRKAEEEAKESLQDALEVGIKRSLAAAAETDRYQKASRLGSVKQTGKSPSSAARFQRSAQKRSVFDDELLMGAYSDDDDGEEKDEESESGND